jgi:hypothetical protein
MRFRGVGATGFAVAPPHLARQDYSRDVSGDVRIRDVIVNHAV